MSRVRFAELAKYYPVESNATMKEKERHNRWYKRNELCRFVERDINIGKLVLALIARLERTTSDSTTPPHSLSALTDQEEETLLRGHTPRGLEPVFHPICQKQRRECKPAVLRAVLAEQELQKSQGKMLRRADEAVAAASQWESQLSQ